MKPIFTQEDTLTKIAHTVWADLLPRSMVQVICLTIDGQKVVCLGPVLHAPHLDLHVGQVQEVEFGEMLPATLAARLVNGDLAASMGVQ